MLYSTLAMVEIHIGILVLLGIGILGGALGAWFFQKIRIPQVVGYIVFGIAIGKSGFGLFQAENIESFSSFTWFALGIIGFLVGGELKFDIFRQYGKQFIQILLWEGLFAFFLVTTFTFVIIFWLTSNVAISLAAGVVFGAIASATDPASTVDVLWEYRARGVLTTTVVAIVALDDALAMTLYGVGTSFAGLLLGQGANLLSHFLKIAFELGGSIVFGLAIGLVMSLFLKFIHQKQERMLAIGIGMLLLVIGISSALGLDVILVTMSMGLLIINFAPHRSEKLFAIVKSFSGPIYVMFFVLVGARLTLNNMPGWLWGIVVVYFLGRSTGKFLGCWLGAYISHAEPVVRKYSGLGIMAQGGVAIGLSIMASEHLGDIIINDSLSLGDAIITAVTATTFLAQLFGPAMAKLSIHLAGESGRNVTEEDMMEKLTVKQAAKTGIKPLRLTDNITKAVQRFSMIDCLACPVIDKHDKLAGIMTFEKLKDILMDSDCWEWLVVADVIDPNGQSIGDDVTLKNASEILEESGGDQLAIVNSEGVPIGILDSRWMRNVVKHEQLAVLSGKSRQP